MLELPYTRHALWRENEMSNSWSAGTKVVRRVTKSASISLNGMPCRRKTGGADILICQRNSTPADKNVCPTFLMTRHIPQPSCARKIRPTPTVRVWNVLRCRLDGSFFCRSGSPSPRRFHIGTEDQALIGAGQTTIDSTHASLVGVEVLLILGGSFTATH